MDRKEGRKYYCEPTIIMFLLLPSRHYYCQGVCCYACLIAKYMTTFFVDNLQSVVAVLNFFFAKKG